MGKQLTSDEMVTRAKLQEYLVSESLINSLQPTECKDLLDRIVRLVGRHENSSRMGRSHEKFKSFPCKDEYSTGL